MEISDSFIELFNCEIYKANKDVFTKYYNKNYVALAFEYLSIFNSGELGICFGNEAPEITKYVIEENLKNPVDVVKISYSSGSKYTKGKAGIEKFLQNRVDKFYEELYFFKGLSDQLSKDKSTNPLAIKINERLQNTYHEGILISDKYSIGLFLKDFAKKELPGIILQKDGAIKQEENKNTQEIGEITGKTTYDIMKANKESIKKNKSNKQNIMIRDNCRILHLWLENRENEKKFKTTKSKLHNFATQKNVADFTKSKSEYGCFETLKKFPELEENKKILKEIVTFNGNLQFYENLKAEDIPKIYDALTKK